VVHEVGHAGDGERGEGKRLEEVRIGARRRRNRRAARVVEVVDETDGDSAGGRVGERAADDRRQVVGEADVVDRDLERPLRLREPVGERACDLLGLLAAVGQRADVDRSDALCARFAAW
jgi:hypothetical protein